MKKLLPLFFVFTIFFLVPYFTSAYTYTRELTVGKRGEDVRQLQIFLNNHGFPIATSGDGSKGYETTYFGEATRVALAKFQASKGISPAAGYFGRATRDAVNAADTGTTSPTPTYTAPTSVPNTSAYQFTRNLRYGDRGTDVTKLQQYLVAWGYLNTEPSGFFGRATEQAVVKYQKAKYITPAAGFFGSTTRGIFNREIVSRSTGNTVANNTNTHNHNINPNDNNTVQNPTNQIPTNTPTTIPNLVISCSSNPSSATVNTSVAFSANATGGTGSYTYSWVDDQGRTYSGQTMSTSFATTGTKAVSLTVSSGSQVRTTNCNVNVNTATNPTLLAYCTANPASAETGTSVTYSATVSGGPSTSYQYTWTGTDGLSGSGSSVSKTYTTAGAKTASLTVTSGSETRTATCQSEITLRDTTTITPGTATLLTSGNWSTAANWTGNAVPTSGKVVIPAGKSVTLNVSNLNLTGLDILGSLEVARQDITMKAGYILVSGVGAQFVAGSVGQPFTNILDITLTGADRAATSIGGRVFGAINGGKIELIGQRPNYNWTMLNATANAGANKIIVQDPVNWRAGDKIIITTTDYDYRQTEEKTVDSVNGNEITLTSALGYRHYGVINDFTGQGCVTTYTDCKIDERGEVGLLSHNIKIQGAEGISGIENSSTNGFGGHMMIMNDASIGRFEGVEFYRMGQSGITGRYPIHWHDVNNGGSNSYIKGSSIHKSFSRFVTVHKTNNVLVFDNVGYDTFGHGFFVEDGMETGVVFDRNLGATVRKGTLLTVARGMTFFFASDERPAIFWTASPTTKYVNNAAAGAAPSGQGFWIDIPNRVARGTVTANDPTGANFCPQCQPFGEFRNNRAHSFVDDGVSGEPWSLLVSSPADSEAVGANGPYHSILVDNFTSFKVSTTRNTDFQFLGGGTLSTPLPLAVVTNSHFVGGAMFVSGHGILKNSIAVFQSPNTPSQPSLENIYEPFRGSVFNNYDGLTRAENSTFIGFESIFAENDGKNDGAFWCKNCKYINSTMLSSRINAGRLYLVPDPTDNFNNGAVGYFTNQEFLVNSSCKNGPQGGKGIPASETSFYWCPGNYGQVTWSFAPNNNPYNPYTGTRVKREDKTTSDFWPAANYFNGIFVAGKSYEVSFDGANTTNLLQEIVITKNINTAATNDAYALPLPSTASSLLAFPAPSSALTITMRDLQYASSGYYSPVNERNLEQATSLEALKASTNTGWYLSSASSTLYLKVNYNSPHKLTLNYGASLAQVIPKNPSIGFAFSRTLQLNDEGDDVKALQVFLNKLGFTIATSGVGSPGNESTYFGAKTREALKKWQVSVGLAPVGIFGEQSMKMIK